MTELDKLEKWLKESEYLKMHGYNYIRVDEGSKDDPYFGEIGGRHQIIVENARGKRVWDAICQWGSYGYTEGLLEVMGAPVVRKADGDTVCGYLTAEDVARRLEEYDKA